MSPTLQTHVQGAPLQRGDRAHLKRHGEGETGLVCTLVLGLTFLLLGPAAHVSSVPQRTIVLCVLMVFLGFSVGGITVPVETLMTKLVVCYYHGRGQSIQVSHFSDSLAAMSGFAVTYGASVGPVSRGVLLDALTFSAGALFKSMVPRKKVIANRSNLDPSNPKLFV